MISRRFAKNAPYESNLVRSSVLERAIMARQAAAATMSK